MRRLLIAAAVVLVFVLMLAADLASRGLAWRMMESLTGEEAPVAQVRGMVEWLGNFTRPPLKSEPLVPIADVDARPYGVNTFLEQEAEEAKRARQVEMIAEAGFGWIRQEFAWEDIEIHARGDFEDRRNDRDGDGDIDADDVISAWDKYDQIVDLAEANGLRLQVRLSNPPSWAHADPAIGEKAPPDDIQDFVNYAVTVAERYKGRIQHYQVWNEPNIYPEWGEQAVDPVAYTDMLCRTYEALKAVDPDIVVISAALAPTINLTDRNLSDYVFLQRMYDAGAGDCFDVMSTQGYGFFSGPSDRRMRPTTLTFSHHLYLRDIMVANGDAHKPIWLAEAAWNAQPEDPALVTSQYGNFGIVSEADAARYMPQAYARAQQEWPWLGVINYWFFKQADDSRRNQSWYYFRMLEPDFTPLPVYDAMRDYIASAPSILYPGVHQAEHWAIERAPGVSMVTSDAAEFGAYVSAQALSFTAHGTDVLVRLLDAESPTITLDGQPLELTSDANNGAYLIHVPLSFVASDHALSIEGAQGGAVAIDSVMVLDQSGQHLLPLLAGIVIGLVVLAHAVIAGLWARRTRVKERSRAH
ncbi:MAG: cellulase family glycosylhydrolase [Anaerolineae bacterium]|nr:cellulase family glycosylhydrolase [Anaerolineae bacterium]